MAYNKKTWANRETEYPTRRKLLSTGIADTYDLERQEGLATVEGDPLNAANLNDLEDRVEAGLGEKANLAGAEFTGDIMATGFNQSPSTYGTKALEIGSFIDFHAPGAGIDFDVRFALEDGFLVLGNPNPATTGKSQHGRILTRPAIIYVAATFTIDLSHAEGRVICMNDSGTDIIITVPKDSVTAFPIGTSIDFIVGGTGEVDFAPVDGDVAILSLSSYKSILGQYSAVSLIKTAADAWVLIGALKA